MINSREWFYELGVDGRDNWNRACAIEAIKNRNKDDFSKCLKIKFHLSDIMRKDSIGVVDNT